MKIIITDKKLAAMGGAAFFTGTAGACSFQAKVYDMPSCFGINEGSISKLVLQDASGTTFAAYDRGWDILPRTQEQLDPLQAITDYFA